MRRLRPGWSTWSPFLGVVLGAGLLPFVLGASAPDPASCPWNAKPIAVLDVADRGALVRHIPALARAPEVAGDSIRVNGQPAGLSTGALHVTVFACLPYSSIPTLSPLLPAGASLPSVVRNIVVIQTSSRDAWWFTDVNLDGFTP